MPLFINYIKTPWNFTKANLMSIHSITSARYKKIWPFSNEWDELMSTREVNMLSPLQISSETSVSPVHPNKITVGAACLRKMKLSLFTAMLHSCTLINALKNNKLKLKKKKRLNFSLEGRFAKSTAFALQLKRQHTSNQVWSKLP